MLELCDFNEIEDACTEMLLFLRRARDLTPEQFKVFGEFHLLDLNFKLEDMRDIYREKMKLRKMEKPAGV